jgi:hypothetical protein
MGKGNGKTRTDALAAARARVAALEKKGQRKANIAAAQAQLKRAQEALKKARSAK